MARYSYKQFNLDNDVIIQVEQPVNYAWSFSASGEGSDDSGDKWVDATMSAYVTHGVASAGDTSAIANSFGGTFDGNITSQDLYYYIGTKYFNMNDPSNGFSWSDGSAVTHFYALMIDNDLVLDRLKAGSFAVTLSGSQADPCSSTYTFILNVPEDDTYPSHTTIRYADSHGSLSSTVVGKAFLDDGIFCFLAKGDEAGAGASGLLTQLFDENVTTLTNSNLANLFTTSGNGICQSLSGNGTEYQTSYIYFCRAYNKEYTYSLNPTYGVSASEYAGAYRVRNDFIDDPKAYITGIGFYDADGDLLAVAKPNVPRKKDMYSEALFKIKLTL